MDQDEKYRQGIYYKIAYINDDQEETETRIRARNEEQALVLFSKQYSEDYLWISPDADD